MDWKHRSSWALWLPLVACGIIAACGGESEHGGPDRVCEPGLQVACACPGSDDGAQACLPDGSGWGDCDCGGDTDAGGTSASGTGGSEASGGSAGSDEPVGGSAGDPTPGSGGVSEAAGGSITAVGGSAGETTAGSGGLSAAGAGGSPGGAGGLSGTGGAAGAGGTAGAPGSGGAVGGEGWPDWLPPPWATYPANTDGIDSWKDPSLGDDVSQLYAGTPGTESPELIYPLDGSMHPNNLAQIELQWSKAVRDNVHARVEVVADDGSTYRFYFACTTPGCAAPMPESEWYYLAQTHAGQSASLTVQETDGSGGPVHTSPSINIQFSPDPVQGELYFWAAANWGIYRAQLGSRGSVPFIAGRSPENDFACAGCHSVSRDGSTLAFAVCETNGENTAAIQTAPTDDPAAPYVMPTLGQTPFSTSITSTANPDITHQGTTREVISGPTDHFGHNVALSPDGTVAAINGVDVEDPDNWPPWFELRDARTGEMLDKVDLGQPPFDPGTLPILPEFSPDGQTIVATLTDDSVAGCTWTYSACTGGLVTIDVSGNQIGMVTALTTPAEGVVHYYPTWSPAGDYVAFVATADATPMSQSDMVDTGTLYLVPATGGPHACPGSTCTELTQGGQSFVPVPNADGPHTTLPKFAPFAQDPTNNILFVSFTTRIRYGWRAEGRSQIWMFAVDTSRLPEDPSFAPIWLPYQQYDDGNLAAVWAETAPCIADPSGGCTGCRPGETCIVGDDAACSCAYVSAE